MTYDILIKNGTIVDGTGAASIEGNLAISGDKIAAVGDVEGSARQIFDAEGCLVTPGFVDMHTHLDAQITWDPMVSPSISHGVTTVLIGNCGFTIAP